MLLPLRQLPPSRRATICQQRLLVSGGSSGVSTDTVTTDPPQLVPELINAALSMLNVLGLLLLFADAQKFEHCEEVEGNVTSRSEL